MPIVQHNPPTVFPAYRSYSHAVEVQGGARLLVISGLNGFEYDGVTLPESSEDQAVLIWAHFKAILSSAGMKIPNLISLRTYLADPSLDEANVRMRVKHLGAHRPASTVICCQLLDPKWKVELEAIAAA